MLHPNTTIVAASILSAILINFVTQMNDEFRLDNYLRDLALRFLRADLLALG